MDYLDLPKQFRQRMILFVGYVLIAVAIVTTSLILLESAYGFSLTNTGTVIQSGLVYFSSHPSAATIKVNGKPESAKTNTRLQLPADIYNISLSRNGYRTWQRNINLQGGSVQHFDYPFLVPKQLVSKKLPGSQAYQSVPGLFTQSPDHRWLVVEHPGSMTDFDIYDLKNFAKAPVSLSLPADLLTKATSSESWHLGEWADDNQHLLLQHIYDDKSEYILLDRTDATQSQNLNTTLSASPTKLTLNNKKYDQYYLYDGTTQALQTASLKSPALVPRLQHVLAYKSYGDNTVLYVTANEAPAGKVLVRLLVDTQTTTLRTLPVSSNYLVDLTQYSGTTYVVMSATDENKVYIYRDPLGQLAAEPKQAIVPSQVLHVEQPNYLSFSATAQFIVAENGTRFGVYDIENKLGYNYTAVDQLDAPQLNASWMDGNRLVYVSHGKLIMIDYDNTNHQVLNTASPAYIPAFAPDYKYVYTLSPASIGQLELTQTALLIPADL